MNFYQVLFLSIGLKRELRRQERSSVDAKNIETLLESVEARSYRRNILALSGIIVLTGLAGADPHDLSVFGVKPAAGNTFVVGVAVVIVQLYWYAMRYQHLRDDGVIEIDKTLSPQGATNIKISSGNHTLVRKSADLFANHVAFWLTVYSWYWIASWFI